MRVCSFLRSGSGEPRLGVVSPDENTIEDLTAINPERFRSFSSLVFGGAPGREKEKEGEEEDLGELIRSELENNKGKVPSFRSADVRVAIPLSPPEVWAAGVTYLRSTQAREVETSLKGLYNYVYDAKRPEVFFKTTGHRCVGPGEDVGIRGDSKWSVPEPELTLVLGRRCEVIGYTIGNDMSARDIEGENPLYLPQAKVFRNCCAIGPYVATRDEIRDPGNLCIDMRILREGGVMFEGSISTSQMKRSLEELLGFLKEYNSIPPCSVFMTGTGIVPPDDFSLMDKDVIEVSVQGIGKLRNTARVLSRS